MSREQRIQQLLEHYISTAWTTAGAAWGPEQRAEIRELAGAICKPPKGWGPGIRGTGECMCEFSPEKHEAWAKSSGYQNWMDKANKEMRGGGAAALDHRCPEHGHEAQPSLWGRNRGLVLHVQAKEWYSLGVKPNEPA